MEHHGNQLVESPNDNYIYCPAARDVKNGGLDHFQHHWLKGRPVIVCDVLELTSGLSWEPMVMWRALREQKGETKKERLFVKALECLTWSEIEVNIHNFFDGYSCGIVGSEDLPSLIKLKDWPEGEYPHTYCQNKAQSPKYYINRENEKEYGFHQQRYK